MAVCFVENAFEGTWWNARGQQFAQRNFLRLQSQILNSEKHVIQASRVSKTSRRYEILQLLPNLGVLKVKQDAFTGRRWNASEQQFRRLKFLRLDKLNIQQWEAQWTSFPGLKRLSLRYCKYLEEIYLEIGEITTLELIETNNCNNSVLKSASITVDGMELSSTEHEDSESEWE
ncbi:hypothetical protein OSB04_015614 [Centaurea solstitialis]|uniref:Uncharacterized protein n=1 Tax=Centaurea solstitialis TaxID=347529 RepID=A0AA38WIX4_9ASTR|nr:hypothetical protein OSB04_015614 [Centaurea solstitialis]